MLEVKWPQVSAHEEDDHAKSAHMEGAYNWIIISKATFVDAINAQ